MFIFSKYFFLSSFNALTIWPFIILKNKNLKDNKVIINHEKIHLRQQIEMLWFIYFIWYLLEFSINLVKYKNFMSAYYHISFEKEAYENEKNLTYLRNRKFWSFLKYY